MRFAVKLRDDDHAILRRCIDITGIGYLRFNARRQLHRAGAKPQAEWLVITKGDCARLVEILDQFPLLSKKARDYAIWRQAMLYVRLRPRSSHDGKGRTPHSWGLIQDLWRQLPAVRAYEPPAIAIARANRSPHGSGLTEDGILYGSSWVPAGTQLSESHTI